MNTPMSDCPSCGNEVPVGAPRCKHCFTDLNELAEDASQRGNPLRNVVILGLVFVATMAGIYTQISHHDQLGQVTVDRHGERLVLVYTSTRSKPTTRQIGFTDVSGIEMEASQNVLGGNLWEVFLLTNGGERVLINRSSEPLEAYASNVAEHSNKQLTIINKIRAGQDIRGGL